MVSFTSGDKVNVVPARATLVVAGVEAAVVEEAAARVTAQTNVAFITESQADGTVKVSARGVAAHAIHTCKRGKMRCIRRRFG